MKILYITFIDFDKAQSGSSVRPQNMYKAFVECGYEVKLLKGQQNKRKLRRNNVREVIRWLKVNTPDVCYVEPPSGPFFNMIDHRLLKKVHRRGIPIGLFYRDFYWKYDLNNFGRGLFGMLKAWVVKVMHIRDWRLFKEYCDIIYFSTILASQQMDAIDVAILPPGCSGFTQTSDDLYLGNRAIYVGSVSKVDGTYLLLDAFKLINAQSRRVTLKLVCRKKEWEQIDETYKAFSECDWLIVVHVDGDEHLKEQYMESDFAVFPRENMFYNNIAMPVKIMEYISYCKPIVSTNCKSISQFITENKVGIITEYTTEDIARGVLVMVEDVTLRQQLVQNCLVTREKNTWRKRAEQVVGDLSATRT